MTLTLVADPTNANANAYCDLAFANSYHEARLFNDEWLAASDPTKTAALVWATQALDSMNWQGTRVGLAAAILTPLRWPRVGVTDRDGLDLDEASVPLNIKKATAELALFLIREDRTEGLATIDSGSTQVGPISFRKNKHYKFPQSVLDLVAQYSAGWGSFQARVERV